MKLGWDGRNAGWDEIKSKGEAEVGGGKSEWMVQDMLKEIESECNWQNKYTISRPTQ